MRPAPLLSLVVLMGCRSAGITPYDPRVPSRAEVENRAPIRWSLSTPEPFAGEARAGPVTLSVHDAALTITSTAGPTVVVRGDLEPPARGGVSLDRGYMLRLEHTDGVSTRWVEAFRGSRIASIFRRVVLDGAEVRIPEQSFEVGDALRRLVGFRGTTIAPAGDSVTLDGETTRPFVAVTDDDDRRGVLFFFPHRPEVRRWYVEDYVVTATPEARLELADGVLRLTIEPVDAPEGRATFDFSAYVMPYDGAFEDALRAFDIGPVPADRSYWERHLDDGRRAGLSALRMLRYHPMEFTSFADSSDQAYGHDGGFTWGNMTKTMKGIRTDPLASQDLLRDQAFRMLTFFVEAGRDKGAPPNLVMNPRWTSQLARHEDIRGAVFCQYWEYRLSEFAQLFRSPYVTEAEKARLYEELQRARVVLDPTARGFAQATPDGGLWFDYLDIPIAREPQWIINTHTTMLGNVGELAMLARGFGGTADEAYWTDLFRRGLRGLLWAARQPWMWQEDDEDELRYARHGDGPRSYHVFMVQNWTPRVARLTFELAPELAADVVRFLKRIARAEIIASDDVLRRRAAEVIERFEERPSR